MTQTELDTTRATVETPTPRSDSIWPRVDIFENDEAFTLLADLPGVEPENVDVRIDGETLVLSALRGPPAEGTPLHQEMVHRDYQRRFKVNAPVVAEEVSASYRDGVLRLRLPKAPESRPRRISITPEG